MISFAKVIPPATVPTSSSVVVHVTEPRTLTVEFSVSFFRKDKLLKMV